MPDIIVPDGWRERLEALAGRRRDLWVLIAALGTVVLVALLWSTRGSAAVIAPPAEAVSMADQGAADTHPDATAGSAHTAPAGEAAGGPATAVPAAASPTDDVVLVHVAGAVRRPGLYELPLGARVADAIDAAGGPRPKAALGSVNLAQPLADGTKLDVPRSGQPAVAAPTVGTATGSATSAPASSTSTSSPGATPGAPIPLNTADQAALETIPEVGPVTAAAILEHRAEIGSFESVEQLIDVTGIGPATLEAIRPYVTV